MFPMRTALLWLILIHLLRIGESNLDTENWMSINIGWLGKLTLKQMCVAGSHNSGMNQITGGTTNAKACKVLTQDLTVGNQLNKGVRFLDLRPVLSGGQITTGNYREAESGDWEGANGQSIESIIEDINTFTKEHKELIIVSLSHTINMDVEEYRLFNQEDWYMLFGLLNSTKNMFHAPEHHNLLETTLGDFTNNGTRPSVFYIVYDQGTGVKLGDLAGKGFFYLSNLNIFQKKTVTDLPLDMLEDQIWLMEKVSPTRFFVLSFILTRPPRKVTTCSRGRNNKRLADSANKHLQDVMHHVTHQIHPNVILVDYFGSSMAAQVTMYTNLRWLTQKAMDSYVKGG